MKYIIAILVLTSVVCCNINRQIKEVTQGEKEVLLKYMTKCIKKTLLNPEISNCPNYDKDNLSKYYEKELSHFSIDNALKEIGNWSVKLNLKKGNDTIVLSLYYPIIGFDPTVGYQTEYYIFGNTTDEGVIGKFEEKSTSFAVSRSSASKIKEEIKYYRKLRNGCETGFLILTYLSPDLKPIDCHSTIGSSPFND